jgi:hypothetical protein
MPICDSQTSELDVFIFFEKMRSGDGTKILPSYVHNSPLSLPCFSFESAG